ncbi:hypothetical protein M2119_000693 [Aurantimicrobium minutum]|uniref:hypothetical protein n=1 Tax=Aurantimicrobium minutum TaxID=708131 RepID=UPI002476999D|nr:hypothetical protein [Aurantimicrobium minutum]MDH6532456.1 hypothetical protein [Aurantimicrobium minutum]
MAGIALSRAAEMLGITPRYARELLKQGKLISIGHGEIDPRSLDTFRQLRLPAGRPTSPTNAAALAELLRGRTPQIPARSLARLRNTIRNAGPWDLALDLLTSSDKELAQLAELTVNPESFLEGRRAQAQLKELQHEWIRRNPARQGESLPLALVGLKTSAQVAKLIKSSTVPDERRRLALDHIADLLSTKQEILQALTAEPARTGFAESDAILAAGISWAAREKEIAVPGWVTITPLPELLWAELMPVAGQRNSQWIPEFRHANIFAEPAHFARA